MLVGIGVNHGEAGVGGTLMQIVPPQIQTTPLRIHQTTQFQAKIHFSGETAPSPARAQPLVGREGGPDPPLPPKKLDGPPQLF